MNLDRLLDHDYRLSRDAQRPDAHDIHQARVATRRLRFDLKTFGSTLDPVWLRHTTQELRWIGTMLGKVRDVDVLAPRLAGWAQPAMRSEEGTAALREALSAERHQAAQELCTALASDRYIDLLDKVHAAIDATPFLAAAAGQADAGLPERDTRSTAALPTFVHERWRKLKRKVRKGGSQASDADLHQMRIAAKRLRYAAETAVPLIGKPAGRTARAAERVQTVLGEFHDAVAAEQWLREEVDDGTLTPRAAFAAGTLSCQQQVCQQQLRNQWRSEWKKLRRRKNRS
jgi:CHAD domain-containing protein